MFTTQSTDTQSGSKRETVTNSDGYFTFASVPVGNYDLAIEAKGFEINKVTGIALSGGEKRNVNATLKVGSTSQSVAVSPGVNVKRGSKTAEASAPTTIPAVESRSGPERGPGVRFASRYRMMNAA